MLGLMAVALFVLGVLTAYFGSGKSRTVGAILLVLGIIVAVLAARAGQYTPSHKFIRYLLFCGFYKFTRIKSHVEWKIQR